MEPVDDVEGNIINFLPDTRWRSCDLVCIMSAPLSPRVMQMLDSGMSDSLWILESLRK